MDISWLVTALVVVAVFGFGAFIVGKVVLGARRDRRMWSAPSITRQEAQALSGGELQDPSAAGSTEGTDAETTDVWVTGQLQSRTNGIINQSGL